LADYCNVSDITMSCGSLSFSATTKPTLVEVENRISDITNEIDFVLYGAGIKEQPTDARILGRLKEACRLGVSGWVLYSRYGNSEKNNQGNKYLEKYEQILEDIKSNPNNYGAITGFETISMSNQVLDGTYTEEQNNNYQADYEV